MERWNGYVEAVRAHSFDVRMRFVDGRRPDVMVTVDRRAVADAGVLVDASPGSVLDWCHSGDWGVKGIRFRFGVWTANDVLAFAMAAPELDGFFSFEDGD